MEPNDQTEDTILQGYKMLFKDAVIVALGHYVTLAALGDIWFLV